MKRMKKRDKYSICQYDLEDNYIREFRSYKECAEYFKTSIKSIHCYICRSQKGKVDKKMDKETHQWCRLVRWLDIEEC